MDVVAQAARALDVAHTAGIVHRDIKPGNLLIMSDGTTKITDFGIAKAREWGDPQLTATGIVMGTAMYVSPEQATGAVVTGSSDIYSLGVVAYECLAGEPPFVAEQPLAIAIMHKHDPVPPLPADVPRQVSDLVMAMLAKATEDRPESALHVADRAEVIMHALRRGQWRHEPHHDLRPASRSGLPHRHRGLRSRPPKPNGRFLPRSPGVASSQVEPAWRSAASPPSSPWR